MEWLLLALMIKHAVADLFVQSFRAPGNKATLLSKSNLLHSGDHAILTFAVIVAFGYTIQTAILMAVLDLVLHYTIDGSKTRFIKRKGWKRSRKKFWRLQALDQALHYITYGLIIFLVDNYGLI